MSLITLAGLGRTYPGTAPVTALADVSLTIDRGEFVCFVGPSGSGKSTLLNLVAMLDSPTTGECLIEGHDVDELSESKRTALRAAMFGFVFQSFHLLDHYSAAENVELGLLYRGLPRSTRSDLARQALGQVGLSHRSDHPANALSGGERQRVAIARAIVGGAPVLVADEPTGNLDSANSQSIIDLLSELNRSGITVILVTHDPNVAASASRLVELRDGRVVADQRNKPMRSPAAAADEMPPGTTDMVSTATSRMRTRDLLREALRAASARRRRMMAVTGAVALAVAFVIATFGLGQTASAQVSERFDARRNREITVQVADAYGPYGLPLREGLPPDTEERLRRVAGVEEVGIIDETDVTVSSGTPDATQTGKLFGVSSGLLETVGAEVAWLAGHAHALGHREAIIGDIVAAQLSLPPLDVRPTILVNGTPFAVVGIVDEVQRAPELLSAILTTPTDAVDVAHAANPSVLISTAPGAARQVAQQASMAIDPLDPSRFRIESPPDLDSMRAEIESDIRSAMLTLGGVAFLASILGIANAASAGIAERTSEIGLRRALGAKANHILKQVTAETVLTGILGGAVGLYVGLLGVLGMTIARGWQPVFDFRLIPVALGAGALAGMAGGLAAALRASRVQPIDALRR